VNPWIRLLGLLVAIVAAALFLKVLPPLVVLAIFVGGVAYANHVLTVVPRRDRARGTAELLGLRAVPAEQAGLSAFPFALLQRPGASTRDVMVGPWRGVEVRIFDVETAAAAPFAAGGDARRFSGAIAPLPFEAPHVAVEPQGFLTPPDERPNVPVVPGAPEPVARAFDVRSADPAFAEGLLDERLTDWLRSREESTGFETYGRAVLVYERWVPARERDVLLEALRGFLDAVGAQGE